MSQFFQESTISDIDIDKKVHLEENGFIEFSQNIILGQVTSGKLNNIKIKYNGLCEIICNYILLEDLLGKKYPLPLQDDVNVNWLNTQPGFEQLGIKFKDNTSFVMNYNNKYGDKITLENLSKVEDTHILSVTNFFTRLIAVLFSIYPCNLFSNSPFAKSPFSYIKLPNGFTQTRVDKLMLSERLNQLEVGFYVKFFAFKKIGLSLNGHSMLIKKINDNKYSFFDPNHGEYLNLNIDELAEKINKSTEEQLANQMVFLDARDFVSSYQIVKKEIDDKELSSIPQI